MTGVGDMAPSPQWSDAPLVILKMKHASYPAVLLGLVLAFLGQVPPVEAAEAPFIDAKAVKERWSEVTPEDMKSIQKCKILFTSKSIGLNLVKGLGLVGKADAAYSTLGAFQRFDLEKKGGLPVVPADIFPSANLVHLLGTRHPYPRRVEELDELMRQDPWKFGSQVDVIMALYAEVKPDVFPQYQELMDGLVRDFPNVQVIHATTSIFAPGQIADRAHEGMEAYNALLRQQYRGKAPVYDLAAILSDDYRSGAVMLPEYTKDPTGVHPSLDPGMIAMGRGFILAVRDTLKWKQSQPTSGAATATPRAETPVFAPAPVPAKAESLPTNHPEYLAVRAILDRNGLSAMKVEGQTEVRGGHVVGLFIQEAGVTEIPDEIGKLAKLERLHCYGDRTLQHPYLKSISPEIGKCTELQDLLLNHNELTTLPVEMTNLTRLTSLSLADNRLRDLPKALQEWAGKFDPKGIGQQR
jgi:hypothetical protein